MRTVQHRPDEAPRRYFTPLDEEGLFAKGVAAWRTDVSTWSILRQVVSSARWRPRDPAGPAVDTPDPDCPIGIMDEGQAEQARRAIEIMLNDPSLTPGLRLLGALTPGPVELQNGALDHNWHHDGLSGKLRRGHAGDFFHITYFGKTPWPQDAGGHFQHAERTLHPDWPTRINAPAPGQVASIPPAERTSLLGWNQSPRFIHRSAPMLKPENRIAMITPVSIRPHGKQVG